jgi:crossover junction endodeoxyribonuclease RuvC
MIVGVDPGLHGALAWTDGYALAVRDMPTREAIVSGKPRLAICPVGVERMLRTLRIHSTHIVIEQVSGMPGQSGPAAFTFGYGVGLIIGIGQTLGYEIEQVHPSRWKAAMNVPASKDGARARASQAWPRYAGLWTRKKDDGRAEASLIALYGWQTRGGFDGSSGFIRGTEVSS